MGFVRIVILMGLAAMIQGCAVKYKILASTDFPNPPQQRIGVLTLDFMDITGQYSPLGHDFEDSLEIMLAPKTVHTITNPAALKHQNAIWAKIENPFVPVARAMALPALKKAAIFPGGLTAEDIVSSPPDSVARFMKASGAEIVIVGSVEEIYYGEKPAALDTYLAFGLIGLAAEQDDRIGKVSFRIQAISLKDRKVLFTKTIDGYSAPSVDGRARALRDAVDRAVQVAVAYILETKW